MSLDMWRRLWYIPIVKILHIKRTEVKKVLEIKRLRERLGLSQRDLATNLGVDVSTVTKWETGNAAPRVALLPPLAKVLQCSIDDLFHAPEDREATAS